MKINNIATFCLALCLVARFNQAYGQTQMVESPDNPVLAYGASGQWDAGLVFLPEVVSHGGQHYLFYSGSPNVMTTPLAIGFATSTDGFTWTKYAANPVFRADGVGFDAFMVAEGKLLLQDSTWVMYYNARAVPGPGPGPAIGRATATDPAGPWTRLDDPVLVSGSAGEWDAGLITPNAILPTDSGFVMYYSGGSKFPFPPSDHAMVGMATSTDGITWRKYDDPATTAPPFAESDPVLKLGAAGSYDSGLAWECDVLKTQNGYEMFYTGDPDSFTGERLCYATSQDGIHWNKDAVNPILAPDGKWASLDLASPTVMLLDGQYFVYFIGNTTLLNGQIGLATALVTSVGPERGEKIPETFELLQNYPNPFNPETLIRFKTPKESMVRIEIYNILGEKIRTLVAEYSTEGAFGVRWNAKDDAGQPVPSGIYLYQLRAGKVRILRKMTLLR